MKKHKNNPSISPEALMTTTIVAAILSGAAYLIIAFVWANIATFDISAQVNSALISGVVFGLAFGYRIRDLIRT